ncbi:unnamed protein product [Penicillium nalgiovense]|nr:unnamed protein product [Penicillium nalgiovense]
MIQHIPTCPSALVNGTWPIFYFSNRHSPLLPTFLQTNLSHQLREFYITTYRDKFFEDPQHGSPSSSGWSCCTTSQSRYGQFGVCLKVFYSLLSSSRSYIVHRTMYILVSLSIQSSPPPTPTSTSHHPLVPVHLLVFGIQAFITTLTSLVVVWSWTDRSVAEKQQLTMLYAPYMALGGFMVLDMVFRLRDKLMPKTKRE